MWASAALARSSHIVNMDTMEDTAHLLIPITRPAKDDVSQLPSISEPAQVLI